MNKMPSENQEKNTSQEKSQKSKNLPIAKNEDVEFSNEAADNEDIEALERAAEADNQ